MRNTRQGTVVPDGEEELNLQQIMETIQTLQCENKDSIRQAEELRENKSVSMKSLKLSNRDRGMKLIHHGN